MDVEISLLWMLHGKGILKACKASGVRGHVDRRPEITYYANNPNHVPIKRTWHRGDLEMEKLIVSDLLIQMYLPDPSDSRPLPVSIYTLDCDRFRFHWLFLDLLSSKSVVGKFDGCLFTFGIPQRVDFVRSTVEHTARERELKINGIPMRLLSKTATGPLGWIKEGTLDISLNITLPTWESSTKHKEVEPEPLPSSEVELIETEEIIPEIEGGGGEDMDSDTTLEMRFDVMFNHLRASAPLYTPELSYINNAVVHPILAYINSHNKHIPLTFYVQLAVPGLEGARSPAEAGMWDAMSGSVAVAFGKIVHDTQNTETLRNVANTLLKDCWMWLSGWVYSPTYIPA